MMNQCYSIGKVRDHIQKLLCLPYLPDGKIRNVFEYLERQAPEDVGRLNEYVLRTWIGEKALWQPSQWSVYGRAIRTNNDCEGLHNRWNRNANGKKTFYWILSCIGEEAKRIEIVASFLAADRIHRDVRESQKKKEKAIFKLWDDYRNPSMNMNSVNLLDSFVQIMSGRFPMIEDLSNVIYEDIPEDEIGFDPYQNNEL